MIDTTDALRRQIYGEGDLRGVDRPLPTDPLTDVPRGVRADHIAVAGGAFGDEGKGRIVDELCRLLLQRRDTVIVYRWNGGANAGHTVIVNGQRLSLHQLPSGALTPGTRVILGKGMVIHPGDLVAEIEKVEDVLSDFREQAQIILDPMAVLALDTHRAFEIVLRGWERGGQGATGRGISPAYADVLYRHPVRVRDLFADDWRERMEQHYTLYAALIRGLGAELASVTVPRLIGEPEPVGDQAAFLARLESHADTLNGWIQPLETQHNPIDLFHDWNLAGIIYEGAQGIGLDPRFGVYPDVTASDPTFSGILHSTEGIVAPEHIAVRAGAIKATYTSSVGARRLPTLMDEPMAARIREDAHEYGATTGRPRDIACIDLPCLRFFAQVSGMTHLILTHLDIAYADAPIRVCTHYLDGDGYAVNYRPDQDYLNHITPQYVDLPGWDGAAMRGARRLDQLPRACLQYIAFLTGALGLPPLMATTGPERDAVISWIPEGR